MSTTSLYQYLTGYGNTMNERQVNWLKSRLAASIAFENLSELWFMYLREQGFTGALPEMMLQWAQQVTGKTGFLVDLLNQLPNSPLSLFQSGEQGLWYDPADLSLGKLNWRRNMLTYTSDFSNSAWVKTNATVTLQGDGSYLIADNTTSGSHNILQATSYVTSYVPYTFSAEVKPAGLNFVRLQIESSTGTVYAGARFDIANGMSVPGDVAVGSTAVNLITSVVATSNGFYRISATVTMPVGVTLRAQLRLVPDATTFSYVGTGVGVYVRGAQLEQAAAASAYQKLTDFNTEFLVDYPYHTIFQDVNGTIPVTAPSQPIGLVLDKHLGYQLGATVANIDFSSSTNWVLGAGWTITGGKLVGTATTTTADGTVSTAVTNKLYKVTYTIDSLTSGQLSVNLGNSTGAVRSAAGTYSEYISCGTTPALVRIQVRNATTVNAVIDNIVVREVLGNHAIQTATSSRPLQGRHPSVGVRNILTYTEELTNNTFWTKINTTVTPSGDGFKIVGTTGFTDTRCSNAFTVPASGAYTISIYAKADDAQYMNLSRSGEGVWFNLATGAQMFATAGFTSVVSAVDSNGYRRYEVRFTEALSGGRDIRICPSVTAPTSASPISGGNDSVKGIIVKMPQHEQSAAATTWQRVVAATDVSEVGKSNLWFFRFDGVDDFLVTNPIDFTSYDKIAVFTALQKWSDAAFGVVLELSATAATNNGSFNLSAPDNAAPNFGFGLRGDTSANIKATTYAAPSKAVISCQYNIAGTSAADEILPRINGVIPTTTPTSSAGVGSFGNYQMYVGRRGGTSAPANMSMYSLLIRSGLSTAVEVANIERLLGMRSGVTLP